MLVLMGCGSAVFSTLIGLHPAYALVGIVFSFRPVILIMIYAIGGISGSLITKLLYPYLCYLQAK